MGKKKLPDDSQKGAGYFAWVIRQYEGGPFTKKSIIMGIIVMLFPLYHILKEILQNAS